MRSDTPFGVLMFDIDHFKPVNDTYGHLTGDRIIRQVARAAERVLRQGDVVVRYGGEEFLALLPSASGRDVGDLAERVRRAVAETATRDGDQSITVTVSVGGAAYPDLAIGGHDGLVHAADEALYSSKAQGATGSPSPPAAHDPPSSPTLASSDPPAPRVEGAVTTAARHAVGSTRASR